MVGQAPLVDNLPFYLSSSTPLTWFPRAISRANLRQLLLDLPRRWKMWSEKELLQKWGVADAAAMAKVPWDLWAGGPEKCEGGVSVRPHESLGTRREWLDFHLPLDESHLWWGEATCLSNADKFGISDMGAKAVASVGAERRGGCGRSGSWQ